VVSFGKRLLSGIGIAGWGNWKDPNTTNLATAPSPRQGPGFGAPSPVRRAVRHGQHGAGL